MESPLIYSLGSVLLVSLVAFIGIITLAFSQALVRKGIIVFVSFAAGALIGDAFIHLLPEAVESAGFTLNVSLYVLLGIAFSFIIEKIIHWHHYHAHEFEEVHPFVYVNLAGDAVHNFIDGVIIAVSYIASLPLGIATTIAVLFHEIPQEIGDYAVLIHGGFTNKKALAMNFITALTSAVGVIAAFLLYNFSENILAFLIPFAAGNFIYIASTDLFPELHKETKVLKSIVQLVAFGVGIYKNKSLGKSLFGVIKCDAV